MRVAIYGRVSTGHQVEHQTIEQQIERLTTHAHARAAEGWALDKEGAVVVSLGAGLVAVALAWWRAPRSPAGFAAALALTCLFVTAFGKKAFLNYYMLVVAMLLTAVAAHVPPAARLREPGPVGQDAACSRADA